MEYLLSVNEVFTVGKWSTRQNYLRKVKKYCQDREFQECCTFFGFKIDVKDRGEERNPCDHKPPRTLEAESSTATALPID